MQMHVLYYCSHAFSIALSEHECLRDEERLPKRDDYIPTIAHESNINPKAINIYRAFTLLASSHAINRCL